MKAPLVGVTGPERGGAAAWTMISRAVLRGGGDPLRITPGSPHSGRDLDALILGGGADVDPERYREIAAALGEGEEKATNVDGGRRGITSPARRLVGALDFLRRVFGPRIGASIDPQRDELELGLISVATRRGIPMLGICRGAQLLNVYFGGTLYPEVAELYVETPEVRTVLPRRRIAIEDQSRLLEILGTRTCVVNALHHQAIRALGKGLKIVARDRNGMVQAVESTGSHWIVGVQWHPEYIPQHRTQRRLFTALVEASQKTIRARQET